MDPGHIAYKRELDSRVVRGKVFSVHLLELLIAEQFLREGLSRGSTAYHIDTQLLTDRSVITTNSHTSAFGAGTLPSSERFKGGRVVDASLSFQETSWTISI